MADPISLERTPLLATRGFPPDEIRPPPSEAPAWAAAKHRFRAMEEWTERAWAARELFEHANKILWGGAEDPRSNERLVKWVEIAAESFALAIYHYGRARDGVMKALRDAPQLSQASESGIRDANRIFDEAFPDWISLRHAMAHAEDIRNEEDRHSHIAPIHLDDEVLGEPGDDVILGVSLFGRTLAGTWRGRVVRCEIGDASIGRLSATSDAFCFAFRAAVKHLQDERQQSTRARPSRKSRASKRRR